MSARVSDIVRAIDAKVPFAWAEPWDNVGLLAGDSDREVTGVLVSLDQTRDSVARARSLDVNVLVTHHPAFREPPARVRAGSGPAGVVFAALDAGVALVAAHTNLDRDPVAAEALPAALGMVSVGPLESGAQRCARVTVFCPPEAVERVAEAMEDAGSGRVGRYDGCAFAVTGEGRYRPLEGAKPYATEASERVRATEIRLETTCARDSAAAVVSAAAGAHPYEEPLIVTEEAEIRLGAARMGRLCELEEPAALEAVAVSVGERLGVRPRVWGEAARWVSKVAVATGSAASMVPHALAGGADVLVCGELRYHDALEAHSSGLAVVEAGHDATEWPLVAVLAEVVRTTAGLADGRVFVDEPVVSWRVV